MTSDIIECHATSVRMTLVQVNTVGVVCKLVIIVSRMRSNINAMLTERKTPEVSSQHDARSPNGQLSTQGSRQQYK